MNDALVVPGVDWLALAPVCASGLGMLLILVLDAVRARRLVLVADLAVIGSLVLALVGVLRLAIAMRAGDWAPRNTFCANPDGTLCAYQATTLTLPLQVIIIVAALICLLLALDGPDARDRAVHHALVLAAVTGALTLVGARDLITLVVALETATVPAVALVALRRDAPGAQAAISLLLSAVVSLGVYLFGAALLLLGTGSLHLDAIAVEITDASASQRTLAVTGVLVLVAGMAYKLSLVPFHFWTPDTYSGAPLPIAAFLSTVSKAGALGAILVALSVGAPALAEFWPPALAVLAAVSMTVANVVALRQRVAIRLLAWSAIAQAGWVILPLAGAGVGVAAQVLPDDSQAMAQARALSGLQAAAASSVAYMSAYVVASLAAFAVVTITARHLHASEEHTVAAYRGLARREPVAAAVLGLALVSLAGLPPGIAGLMAKVVAVRPVVDSGAWLVAVVAAVNVAIALAYYLRWTVLLIAAPVPGQATPTWMLRRSEGLALGLAAGLLVAVTVWPQLLFAVLASR